MKPVYRIADTRKTILTKSLHFVTKELVAICRMEEMLENIGEFGDYGYKKAELMKQVLELKSDALIYLRNIERMIKFEARQRGSFNKRYNNAKSWFLLSWKSL